MLSILVLSYNHPEITQRAVQSALTWTAPENIFLIHNGSLEKNVHRLQTTFPNIHHKVIPVNKGYSSGFNQGIEVVFQASKNPWILFLTNDCELIHLPTDLPPKPGLWAPQVLLRNTGRVHSLGGLFTPYLAKLQHLEDHSLSQMQSTPNYFFRKYFYVPGTAFYLHRQVWQSPAHSPLRVDESLHTYWEDVEYSVLVQKNKMTTGVFPACTIRHGVGKTCHKDPFYTNFLFQRNRKKISRKYCPIYLRPILEIQLLHLKLKPILRKFLILLRQ